MTDQFTTPEITVLGEQDGPAERRLKEALGVVFGLDRSVIRAYLAHVLHDGKNSGVMLALLTDEAEDSEKLVAQAGRTFAALLNTREDLDIIFLSAEKDAEISQVCRPFYARKP